MKTQDLIIKDEGQFWGLNVKTTSEAGEQFAKNYFNGLIKRNFYVPMAKRNYFVSLALSCGLTTTIL